MAVRRRQPKGDTLAIDAVHREPQGRIVEGLGDGHPGRVPAVVFQERFAHEVEHMRRPTKEGDERGAASRHTLPQSARTDARSRGFLGPLGGSRPVGPNGPLIRTGGEYTVARDSLSVKGVICRRYER